MSLGPCTDLIVRVQRWQDLPAPESRWARRSRSTMTIALHKIRDVIFDMPIDDVIKHVNAAYPFGERAHHPYKQWRAELKLLRQYLSGPAVDEKAPTAEDYAAVLVAIDMFESGDVDGARRLLNEQAPRRLGRECPACKAKRGKPCRDHVGVEIVQDTGASIANKDRRPVAITLARAVDKYEDRIVPHVSRVEPPSSGPLFGGVG